MTEPMYPITPNLSVPVSRYLEWLQGTRPLPGYDPWPFFEQGVKSGMLSPEEAVRLLQRHLELEETDARVTHAALDGKKASGAI